MKIFVVWRVSYKMNLKDSRKKKQAKAIMASKNTYKAFIFSGVAFLRSSSNFV